MSSLTLTQLQAFYNIDRQAYARLVSEQGFDSDTSKKIVAFWYWLETLGCKNFVHESVELVCGLRFNALANESALCLNCLDEASFSLAHSDDHLQVISEIAGPPLSLKFFYARKESARIKITKFVRDVCDRAFTDVVPTNNVHNQFHLLVVAVQTQVTFHRQEDKGNCSQMMANPQTHSEANKKSQTTGTLFVTFSRGHPVTREQLGEFFIRRYGEYCVENILMEDALEPLFALVIVRSLSHVTEILGQHELKQFNIHGKDIRVRRYVRKTGTRSFSSIKLNKTTLGYI